MAYHRYTTDGIVLRTSSRGERDLLCLILTRDIGTIYARARSAKLPRSKMVQGLQEGSFSTCSFIRGAQEWKIVGVHNQAQAYSFLRERKNEKRVFARVLRFLQKTISGEEQHPELFTIVRDLYEVLCERVWTNEELFAIECIALFLILDELGHMPHREEYGVLVTSAFSEMSRKHAQLIKEILKEDINRVLTSGAL